MPLCGNLYITFYRLFDKAQAIADPENSRLQGYYGLYGIFGGKDLMKYNLCLQIMQLGGDRRQALTEHVGHIFVKRRGQRRGVVLGYYAIRAGQPDQINPIPFFDWQL